MILSPNLEIAITRDEEEESTKTKQSYFVFQKKMKVKGQREKKEIWRNSICFLVFSSFPQIWISFLSFFYMNGPKYKGTYYDHCLKMLIVPGGLNYFYQKSLPACRIEGQERCYLGKGACTNDFSQVESYVEALSDMVK